MNGTPGGQTALESVYTAPSSHGSDTHILTGKTERITDGTKTELERVNGVT